MQSLQTVYVTTWFPWLHSSQFSCKVILFKHSGNFCDNHQVIMSCDSLLSNLNAINDPNMPQWAIVLMECFKGVITILQDIKGNNDLIDEVKAENVKLNNEIVSLTDKIDDLEQRSRNSCLLIHGVEEQVGENTDSIASSIIKDRFNIPIDELDIQLSHRLGPPNSKRPLRSNKIIVRFMNYKKRKEVFNSKKKLKGQGIVISENLTAIRYKIYQAAISQFDRNVVWTSDGRIFAKLNDNIVVISSLEDLNKY